MLWRIQPGRTWLVPEKAFSSVENRAFQKHFTGELSLKSLSQYFQVGYSKMIAKNGDEFLNDRMDRVFARPTQIAVGRHSNQSRIWSQYICLLFFFFFWGGGGEGAQSRV